jgi:hypothetical protein
MRDFFSYKPSMRNGRRCVQVRDTTVSGASGNYRLFVEPGSYTLVGYKDGYVRFHAYLTRGVVAPLVR